MLDPLLVPELREMLNDSDVSAMREFCAIFHPAVVAENLGALVTAEAWKVLSQSPLQRQVEVFEFMELDRQIELVSTLEKAHLSALIEEMAPDDRVGLLRNLEDDQVELLLPLVAQAERSDIRKLLSYPESSAGALMTTEYASLREELTVREALAALHSQAPNRETIYYVYVLDEARHLHGFVSLRKLILARPDSLVRDIMDRDVLSVRVDEDQESVANKMARYDFIAMPVVDDENRLVGIITHDDVLDVMREEATEDAHRMGAVAPLEESYLGTPFHTLAWKRGIWLIILFFAALSTAFALRNYQTELELFDWLVLFIPLVISSGGNSGSQSSTLIISALATKDIDLTDWARIVRRELAMGLMLGGVMGIFGYLCALFLAPTPFDALVIPVTILSVVIVGTCMGSMLPLIFKRFGLDPALMSNQFVAGISDLLGILIYVHVAMMFLI